MKVYEVWDGVERGGPGTTEEYCGTFRTKESAQRWIDENPTQCWGHTIKEIEVKEF